jgi:hypothetical protein
MGATQKTLQALQELLAPKNDSRTEPVLRKEGTRLENFVPPREPSE